MSSKRKRNLRGTGTVNEVEARRIRDALCGNSY
jgi:ribosomal protein L35